MRSFLKPFALEEGMEYVDSVVMIPGTMAHCYDVNHGGKRILIDAGTAGSGKKIVSYYEKLHSKPEILLITHYHPDHIGGIPAIREAFNPRIYVPEGEKEVIAGKRRMVPADSIISKIMARTVRMKRNDGLLTMSDFHLDGVEVLSTAGHTPDSRSFIFENLKGIFVGDAAMKKKDRITFNRSFTLFPDRAEKSIETITSYRGYTVYPGHGNIFKIQ
jgi:glyoxylase-like metal-dependent hydrolase (beta-lactamase superfamily II)